LAAPKKSESPEKPKEKHEVPMMNRVEESLISFDDEPTPLPNNSGFSGPSQSRSNMFVSSLTMDQGLEQTSSNLSGSYYGTPSTANPYAPSTNPYGATPAININNPYASTINQPYVPPPSSNNPYGTLYGASTPNPYAPTSSSQPNYQQQPPVTSNGYQQQTPDPSSMALTPYQGPGGSNPSPYVDAAGRLAMGQQQQQQQQQQVPPMPSAAYGFGSQTPSYSGGYNNNLGSPSNQSYGAQSTTSQFSYGSAPSFAQPPQQQQPQYPGYSTQQYNQPQSSYGNFSGY
jgi:hypothetical protein